MCLKEGVWECLWEAVFIRMSGNAEREHVCFNIITMLVFIVVDLFSLGMYFIYFVCIWVDVM